MTIDFSKIIKIPYNNNSSSPMPGSNHSDHKHLNSSHKSKDKDHKEDKESSDQTLVKTKNNLSLK